MKSIWAIAHRAVIDGHWGHTITYVEEKTAEKALEFFNKKSANNHWTQKARIEDVEQIKIHRTGQK